MVFSGRVAHVEGNMIACAVAWLIDEVAEVYLLVNACAATRDTVRKAGAYGTVIWQFFL